MDRMTIRGLRARGNVVIDVVLGVDRGAAATAGHPAPGSELISKQVAALVEQRPVDLAEPLARELAAMCLGHPGVREVEITVHRPEVAGEPHSGDVTVTVSRRRQQRPSVTASPRTTACVR